MSHSLIKEIRSEMANAPDSYHKDLLEKKIKQTEEFNAAAATNELLDHVSTMDTTNITNMERALKSGNEPADASAKLLAITACTKQKQSSPGQS